MPSSTEDVVDIVVRKDITKNLNKDITDGHVYIDMTDPEEFTNDNPADC